MSALAMQIVIARLCADFGFRRTFFSEPDKTLAEFDLTREEIDSIKALDMPVVREYALSLVTKRTELIKKWFGMTFAYLEAELPQKEVNQLLHRYGVETYRDREELGGEWLRGESERFHEYLRGYIERGEVTLPYFSDLLEYEYSVFSMRNCPETYQSSADYEKANVAEAPVLAPDLMRRNHPVIGIHARVRRFDYDVAELVACLDEGKPMPTPTPSPTWLLFLRTPAAQTVIPSVISLPLKELVELCTGELTTEEIITDVARRHASDAGFTEEELKNDCLDVLSQLYDMRIVTLIAGGADANDGRKPAAS